MVRVELFKDQKNMVRSFRVEGHTGYADHGEDIICAGISAITQTALVGLLNYLEKKPYYKREAGLLACTLGSDLDADDMQKAQIILGTMEIGLREIEFQYQDFIEIKIRRC